MDEVKAIRITDPYILNLVAKEQERRGEATATKTAARLITERMAQIEMRQQSQRETIHVAE